MSDLHLAVGALGAGLAGFGADTLLRKSPRATDGALRVSLRATFPGNTLATSAFGAGRTQAVGAQEEVAVVTFTLCVLSGRARGHHGNTGGALGTGKARTEAVRGGKLPWETDLKNQCQSG